MRIATAVLAGLGLGLLAFGNVGGMESGKSSRDTTRMKIRNEYESITDYRKEKYRQRYWVDVDTAGFRCIGPDGSVQREVTGDFSGGSRPEASEFRLFARRDRILLTRTKFLESESFEAEWEIIGADGSFTRLDWTAHGDVWPSPDGQYLVGIVYAGYNNDGLLRFFGLDGKLRKEVKAFPWGASHSRIVFSADGEYGVLLQMGEKFDPERGSVVPGDDFGAMAIFNREGDILARHEQASWRPVGPGDGDGIPHVRVLSNTKHVVLAEGDVGSTISVFDFEGHRLWSAAGFAPSDWCDYELALSSAKIMVVAICEQKASVKVLDEATGKLMVTRELDLRKAAVPKPEKPIPLGQQSWFKLLGLGARVALIFSNAKREKAAATRNGVLIFNFNGDVEREVGFAYRVNFAEADGEAAFVVGDGTRIKKWGFDE